MLDQGADPDAQDSSARSLSVWELLLDKLHGIHPQPTSDPSALLLALQNPNDEAITKALLDKGADPNGTDANGEPFLWLALEKYRPAAMQLLLQHGAKVNARSGDRTLLMWAAGWSGEDMITILLDAGANVDAQGERGETALMYAVNKGRVENIAPLLARHADVRIKNQAGKTALSLAQEHLTDGLDTLFGTSQEDRKRIVQLLDQADAR